MDGDSFSPQGNILPNSYIVGINDRGSTLKEIVIPGLKCYDAVNPEVNLVNKHRSAEGLAPLTVSESLTELAMKRAEECALFYSHTRPDQSHCLSIDDHEGIYPGLVAGENIAAGQMSVEEVMDGWMNSPSHRDNILYSEFNQIGVGCYYAYPNYYWVQLFGAGYDAQTVTRTDREYVEPAIQVLQGYYGFDDPRPSSVTVNVGEKAHIPFLINRNVGSDLFLTQVKPYFLPVRRADGTVIAKVEVSPYNGYAYLEGLVPGSGKLTMSATEDMEDSLQIDVTVIDPSFVSPPMAVVYPNWEEVQVTDSANYGAGNWEMASFPEIGTALTPAGESVSGFYKIVDPGIQQEPGKATITVCFTVTTPGNYQDIKAYKDYEVTILPAEDCISSPPGVMPNWDVVSVPAIVPYGTMNAKCVSHPLYGTAKTVDGDTVEGVYAIVRPAATQKPGKRTVIVSFGVISEGKYEGYVYYRSFDVVISDREEDFPLTPNWEEVYLMNPVPYGAKNIDTVLLPIDATATTGDGRLVVGDYEVENAWELQEPGHRKITVTYTATERDPYIGRTFRKVFDVWIQKPGMTSSHSSASVVYNDVKAGSYYEDAVTWAMENQITTGISSTSFGPSQICQRGQVVTFLWRAAGCPEPETTVNPFTDVKPSDYYYKSVLWAVENGITSGTSKTTFSPKQACQRCQVATFLWRAAGEPKPGSSLNPFTDVRSKSYYYDAVLWAVEKEITKGTSKTAFSPSDSCKREHVVTFLWRDAGKP